jgi:hypothetical protein
LPLSPSQAALSSLVLQALWVFASVGTQAPCEVEQAAWSSLVLQESWRHESAPAQLPKSPLQAALSSEVLHESCTEARTTTQVAPAPLQAALISLELHDEWIQLRPPQLDVGQVVPQVPPLPLEVIDMSFGLDIDMSFGLDPLQPDLSKLHVSVQLSVPDEKPKFVQVTPSKAVPSQSSLPSTMPFPQLAVPLHVYSRREQSLAQVTVPLPRFKPAQVFFVVSFGSQASPSSMMPLPQRAAVVCAGPLPQAPMSNVAIAKNSVFVMARA